MLQHLNNVKEVLCNILINMLVIHTKYRINLRLIGKPLNFLKCLLSLHVIGFVWKKKKLTKQSCMFDNCNFLNFVIIVNTLYVWYI